MIATRIKPWPRGRQGGSLDVLRPPVSMTVPSICWASWAIFSGSSQLSSTQACMSEGKCRKMSLGAPKGETADNMYLKTMNEGSPIAPGISDTPQPENPPVDNHAHFAQI